jgi:hypothetical protein
MMAVMNAASVNRRSQNMPRRHDRWLAVALIGTAVGIGACGGDDADTGAKQPVADAAEPITIKTRLSIPSGDVLDGSSIGDEAFCPGGSFRDGESGGAVDSVIKTISCSGGRLTIRFNPRYPQGDPDGGRTQRGAWTIVTGSGEFEGLRGHGTMVVKFAKASASGEFNDGRETFTGTITRTTATTPD